MKFLQQPIERKLSRILGSQVTFDRLKISPLTGRLEAEGMAVAGDEPAKPLLSVRRITAQVSVAKALAGQLAIKSVTIEGPQIQIRRRPDGSLNLPKRTPQFAAPTTDETDEEESTPWQFEAKSIQIEDGQIRFQDGSYIAAAEQISGELKYQNNKIDAALTIAKLGRRDIPVEFGPLDVTSQIDVPGNLAEVVRSPIRLILRFASELNISLDSPNPSAGRAVIGLQGKLDVSKLLSAIPPQITLPSQLTAIKFHTPIDASFRMDLTLPIGSIFSGPAS